LHSASLSVSHTGGGNRYGITNEHTKARGGGSGRGPPWHGDDVVRRAHYHFGAALVLRGGPLGWTWLRDPRARRSPSPTHGRVELESSRVGSRVYFRAIPTNCSSAAPVASPLPLSLSHLSLPLRRCGPVARERAAQAATLQFTPLRGSSLGRQGTHTHIAAVLAAVRAREPAQAASALHTELAAR